MSSEVLILETIRKYLDSVLTHPFLCCVFATLPWCPPARWTCSSPSLTCPRSQASASCRISRPWCCSNLRRRNIFKDAFSFRTQIIFNIILQNSLMKMQYKKYRVWNLDPTSGSLLRSGSRLLLWKWVAGSRNRFLQKLLTLFRVLRDLLRHPEKTKSCFHQFKNET